jgi:hypothetical protein
MAGVLGNEDSLPDMLEESDRLTNYVNRMLWDAKNNFYYDRFGNGQLSSIKHIGAFWALLAECVPPDRIPNLVFHLENPSEFNRVHRVPALSADDPNYSETGGYWCGGVWAPTNYMVLKGLGKNGWQDLAHRIAINHNDCVVRVFESDDTPWKGADQFKEYFHLSDLEVDDHHTLWENYAPDSVAPGSHSKPGYVGWSGLPPISVLLEDIFGLVPNAPSNRLTWRIKLLEEHGVNRYPFGLVGSLDLKCHSRISKFDRPNIEIHSNIPLTLETVWDGGRDTIHIEQELDKSHSPR